VDTRLEPTLSTPEACWENLDNPEAFDFFEECDDEDVFGFGQLGLDNMDGTISPPPGLPPPLAPAGGPAPHWEPVTCNVHGSAAHRQAHPFHDRKRLAGPGMGTSMHRDTSREASMGTSRSITSTSNSPSALLEPNPPGNFESNSRAADSIRGAQDSSAASSKGFQAANAFLEYSRSSTGWTPAEPCGLHLSGAQGENSCSTTEEARKSQAADSKGDTAAGASLAQEESSSSSNQAAPELLASVLHEKAGAFFGKGSSSSGTSSSGGSQEVQACSNGGLAEGSSSGSSGSSSCAAALTVVAPRPIHHFLTDKARKVQQQIATSRFVKLHGISEKLIEGTIHKNCEHAQGIVDIGDRHGYLEPPPIEEENNISD
jgi:hypothetical protein